MRRSADRSARHASVGGPSPVEMAFGLFLILVAILEIAVIVRVVQRGPAS